MHGWSRLLPGSDLEKQALARIPWRRFGEHGGLRNLVAYLLSDASPYQTVTTGGVSVPTRH